MNHLLFGIMMRARFNAVRRDCTRGSNDEEWRWHNRGRYYALEVSLEKKAMQEGTFVSSIYLYERIMPENEATDEKPTYKMLTESPISGMEKEDVLKIIYKGMISTLFT